MASVEAKHISSKKKYKYVMKSEELIKLKKYIQIKIIYSNLIMRKIKWKNQI
jgi:hypothetical protein